MKLLNCYVLSYLKRVDTYFENGNKNMSSFFRDDNVLDKYNEIWDKIKKKI